MGVKAFYHGSDIDGHASGAIIKKKFPEAEIFPINYGEKFPWDKILPDDVVYMVDYSLDFPDMMKLRGMCSLFVWIDHHKTAIEEEQKYLHEPIDGLRLNGKAGCELTWKYLFPDKSEPYAVHLIGRYDVWDLYLPEILKFQKGLKAVDTDPIRNPDIWKELLHDMCAIGKDILEKGETILKYEKEDAAKYCRMAAFDTELDGLKCIAVNRGIINSQFFESVWDKTKYHAMLSFYYMPNTAGWSVSLYTDRADVDVSEVAKRHGGGGHAQASGFPCAVLPFKI